MSIGKANARNVRARTRDDSHLLREIIRTYQILMSAFIQTIGMPPSRVVLMRLLAKSSGNVASIDLARQLGTKTHVVSRQLAEMEADGLVRVHPDPSDRRRNYFQLSPKGRKAFRASQDRSRQLEHALLSRLGSKETAIAADVLARLRNLIESPVSALANPRHKAGGTPTQRRRRAS